MAYHEIDRYLRMNSPFGRIIILSLVNHDGRGGRPTNKGRENPLCPEDGMIQDQEALSADWLLKLIDKTIDKEDKG